MKKKNKKKRNKKKKKIKKKEKKKKKNCVIFFDCHGKEINKYLFMNKKFKKDFNIKFITLNNYVVINRKFFDNTKLDDKHIMLIKNNFS